MVAGDIVRPNGPAFSPDEKLLYVRMGWGTGNAEQDGVSIFNKDAKLIGRIDLPERCANLCFGGRHRNRLFMAASTSVYSLYVNTQGVAGG